MTSSKSIFGKDERYESAVIRFSKLLILMASCNEVAHYNLDMVLALGFRVRSPVGVRFRRWANDKLKEYIVKGFVLDDTRDLQYRPGHAKWGNFLNRIV